MTFGPVTKVRSDEATGKELSQADIFKKAKKKYASLTSYSDEGKVTATTSGITFTTTFTIKLARPNLYRISWVQSTDSRALTMLTKPKAVWCAGEGNFLEMGRGPEKEKDQETALASATGISGGAAASIPSTFFNVNWGNQLSGAWLSGKRLPDEKVDGADCYVFTEDLKHGHTRMLWIGKQDFLIRQVRTITSAEALKPVMDKDAKINPSVDAATAQIGAAGVTSTETHTKIVVNRALTPSDFKH